MKRKLIVVTLVFLALAMVGGVVSPSIEQWWQNRGIDPGQVEVRRLSQLYQAEVYDRVLTESGKSRDDSRFRNYRPQILYLQWVTNRRIENAAEAEVINAEFLQKYPEHGLAADMQFADAMTLLAQSDYSKAAEKLAMIESKWPDAKVAVKAREIRGKVESRKQKVESRKESAND